MPLRCLSRHCDQRYRNAHKLDRGKQPDSGGSLLHSVRTRYTFDLCRQGQRSAMGHQQGRLYTRAAKRNCANDQDEWRLRWERLTVRCVR